MGKRRLRLARARPHEDAQIHVQDRTRERDHGGRVGADPRPNCLFDLADFFDRPWPVTEYGFYFAPDQRRQHAYTILDAVSLGLRDTQKSMVQILQNVRQMIVGRIAWKKSLGGPISIARIAYSIAGHDAWEFVFFLALISVNLAVINFLPIPVLDGGHMVFLLYEAVRGKPASEGVRAGATYVGLAFLLSLMVLVFWLDIGRLFPS